MSDLTTVVGRHFILKDKKYTSKFFIFRLWVGYGLDATLTAIGWVAFGYYFASTALQAIFITYLALILTVAIILTVVTGWKDASGKPDNYKWVRYAMGYFKLTSLINAGFVFFQVFSSQYRDIPAIIIMTVTGIDMAMNFIEMAASLAGFECNEINPLDKDDEDDDDNDDDVKKAYDVSDAKGDEMSEMEANTGSKQTEKGEGGNNQDGKMPQGRLPALKPDPKKAKAAQKKAEPKSYTPKQKTDKKFDNDSKTDSKKADTNANKNDNPDNKSSFLSPRLDEAGKAPDPVLAKDVEATMNATDTDKSTLYPIKEENNQQEKSAGK